MKASTPNSHRRLRMAPALFWTPLCAVLMLAGCANLAPRYERPQAPVPAALDNTASESSSAETYVPLGWDAVVLGTALLPSLRSVAPLAAAGDASGPVTVPVASAVLSGLVDVADSEELPGFEDDPGGAVRVAPRR